MGDQSYPAYRYAPQTAGRGEVPARYGQSPQRASAAAYGSETEDARYRGYEGTAAASAPYSRGFSRAHDWNDSMSRHVAGRSYGDIDDYPARASHRPTADDHHHTYRRSDPRDEDEAYYGNEAATDRYERFGPSHVGNSHSSWSEHENNIQPSYRRSVRSPVHDERGYQRSPHDYPSRTSPRLAAAEARASPLRPAMSIFSMLNDRASNGSPGAAAAAADARGDASELQHGVGAARGSSPESPRVHRVAFDPARDFGYGLAHRDEVRASSPGGSRARFRDYSPDDEQIPPPPTGPVIKREAEGCTVASISHLIDDGSLPAAAAAPAGVREPPPPALRRRSSSRLEAARTLERFGNENDAEPTALAMNGSSNGASMSPKAERRTEAAVPSGAPPPSAKSSGKLSLKLRNNPLPPSKDNSSFYAPPPPTKRSRDADGWESDLSNEENRPVWQAELETYMLDFSDRKRLVERIFTETLERKQAEIGHRLARAYEGRHHAMLRQIRLREQQELALQESRRREREESARKLRDREIELELLGTLTEGGAKGQRGAKARASHGAAARGDGSGDEGDELEEEDAGAGTPRNGRVGATIKLKKSRAENKNKKRKLDDPTQAGSSPALGSDDDDDVPLAAGLDAGHFAGGAASARAADADESMLDSRLPSPTPDEANETMVLDAQGKVPIDARRAQQLEDAHRRIWTTIAKRDVPKIYRTVLASASSKAMYWRRLSSVVQREAKRGAARNTKTVKDAQLRARKVMREVLVFWKRNEKEERELRKKAEKEALEKAKKEEEMREAKRQARKLNFLISQTELYSHFVGSKLKTAEAEESEETAGSSKIIDPNAQPSTATVPAINPHMELTEAEERLAELGEIDFDDDDETNLRAHAARNAQEAVRLAKEKAQAFDAAAAEERRRNEAAQAAQAAENGEDPPATSGTVQEKDLGKAFDSDDMNFLNPTSMGQMEVKQPKMLTCQLKEYQLKGLNWLANLYEQGINGILADEMGLGKTVQSISLMAYLAEVHDIWGPFLVIAPASTLHNWQQEISKFVPSLKALPYWGNVKDRAVLRKFWNRKQISYNRDAPFHVLVTSYQLVVSDEKYFQRVKWQYMILDEAQAIKSSSSIRWKTLLGFNCRNRLLLTGTPVQNSMQELWALLHFIMPSLFDSHDEFSEWFSKDIESHAENKGTLNEHQLRRLHMILKPFMLRRIKKNVQNELGDKIEIDILCDMSARQKMLYKGLRSHISLAELMDKATANDEAGLKSLMNLVMQFRKVCNHPELFERADVQAPFAIANFARSGSLAREGDLLNLPDSTSSLIEYRVPKLVVREGGLLDVPGERSRKGFDTGYLNNLLNIWRAPYVHRSLDLSDSAFAFLPLLGLRPSDVERAFHRPGLSTILASAEEERYWSDRARLAQDDDFAVASVRPMGRLLHPIPSNSGQSPSMLLPLDEIVSDYCRHAYLAKDAARATLAPAVAPPIRFYSNDRPFMESQETMRRDPKVSAALFGLSPEGRESMDRVEALQRQLPGVPPVGLVANSSLDQLPHNGMSVPQMNKLIVDSSKLARLDSLLRELKAGGHRVLIYFQMTKMIDLMEEYLIYRQYKYLRLDGASKISDRRDMVTDWQTKPELFIFLLSTRAGGLGINLTAADTVIFYDHDWNPSNDSQAMDRAHRLGQTKQVTVYRLITKGTIDERIVRLARNKKEVQDIVVGTKAYSETGMAKPQEIVSLLLDDDELAESMLRRKQAEEAQTAQDKADSARAMHAKRRLNKDKAAATQSPAPSGLDWALEDDEDDFFGARPPTRADTETVETTPQLQPQKKRGSRKARFGDASERTTPLELDGEGTSPAGSRRKAKSHRKKTMEELAGVDE
ncbi:putative DNA helicase ino80 [Thecaphora frezii]